MDGQRYGRGPGERLQLGAAILANARVVDTAPVKRRLQGFATAHRNYVAIQNKIQAVDADLHGAMAKAARRGKELDAAVEALALALAIDGHPRAKPFAALGGAAPSDVRQVANQEKPQTVHRLAEAALSSRAAGRTTCEAARAADQAADKLQAAQAAIGPLKATLGELRRQRQTLGQPWNRALAALRREARSAEDDGAVGLYRALFGSGTAATRQNDKPAPTPAPQPAPMPESTA
jgi:hypothetical protein